MYMPKPVQSAVDYARKTARTGLVLITCAGAAAGCGGGIEKDVTLPEGHSFDTKDLTITLQGKNYMEIGGKQYMIELDRSGKPVGMREMVVEQKGDTTMVYPSQVLGPVR